MTHIRTHSPLYRNIVIYPTGKNNKKSVLLTVLLYCYSSTLPGYALGRQLRLEHLELSGELECPETSTVRQYTLVTSDSEEDLTDEKTISSEIKSEIEIPD